MTNEKPPRIENNLVDNGKKKKSLSVMFDTKAGFIGFPLQYSKKEIARFMIVKVDSNRFIPIALKTQMMYKSDSLRRNKSPNDLVIYEVRFFNEFDKHSNPKQYLSIIIS